MTDKLTNPRISVIVPIFKCEEYVAQCIESLKQQTLVDFEALCVNDASPDRSLSVAKKAAGDDPRFAFFDQPQNKGLSATRNVGIKAATGDILVFLDSDDYFTPNALELIAAKFSELDLDDLYFNAKSFYEGKRAYSLSIEDFSHRPDFPGVATGMELFTFFEEQGQFHPQAALRAIRRSFLTENCITFYEGILHEDLLFTFQTLVTSKRSSFLNEPIYQRRIHEGAITTAPKKTMRNIEGHLVFTKYATSWLESHADELDASFIAAMSHRINSYYELCAEWYYKDITADAKQQYLDTLPPKERVFFEMQVAQRAALLEALLESPTFKAGRAATALPRLVRDKIAYAKQTKR